MTSPQRRAGAHSSTGPLGPGHLFALVTLTQTDFARRAAHCHF